MDKDLIEDKLNQLIDQFSEGKINYRGFYINYMMEMRKLVRYYLLAISVRCYNFNKTSTIANKAI